MIKYFTAMWSIFICKLRLLWAYYQLHFKVYLYRTTSQWASLYSSTSGFLIWISYSIYMHIHRHIYQDYMFCSSYYHLLSFAYIRDISLEMLLW